MSTSTAAVDGWSGRSASRRQLGAFTYVIDDLLSSTECAEVIASAEHAGLMRHRSGTRDQVTFSNDVLSRLLAARLQPLIPERLVGRTGGPNEDEEWMLSGLNSDLRVTRYTAPADELPWHMDAVKFVGSQCFSAFTLIIYLTGHADAHGGCTEFEQIAGSQSLNRMWVGLLQPKVGGALLLAHDVVHRGAPLLEGVKYILRTEILYASEKSRAEEAVGTSVEDGGFDLLWPVVGAALRPLRHRRAVDSILEAERLCSTGSLPPPTARLIFRWWEDVDRSHAHALWSSEG